MNTASGYCTHDTSETDIDGSGTTETLFGFYQKKVWKYFLEMVCKHHMIMMAEAQRAQPQLCAIASRSRNSHSSTGLHKLMQLLRFQA